MQRRLFVQQRTVRCRGGLVDSSSSSSLSSSSSEQDSDDSLLESSSDVDDDNHDRPSREAEIFRKLAQNRNVSEFHFPLHDVTAIEIGLDLPGNQNTTSLTVIPSSQLSEQGVVTFLRALRDSNVKRLCIGTKEGDRPLPAVMKKLYHGMLATMLEVELIGLDDNHAALLELIMKDEKTVKLQALAVHLGSFTAAGAQSLVRAIQTSGIQHFELDVGRNLILQDDASIAATLYSGAIKTVQNVKFIRDINNNRIMKLGPQLVGNTTLRAWLIKVTKLRLNGARALADGIRGSRIEQLQVEIDYSRAVSKAWRIFFNRGLCHHESSSRLTMLDLEVECFCDHSHRLISPIAESLPFLTSLRKLRLCKINIRNQGVQAIVDNWDVNSSLQELDLDYGAIEAEGARIMAEAITNHPALVKLKLNRNKIGFDGFQAIATHLANSRLKELSVTGDSTLCYRYGTKDRKMTCQALALGIRSNYHLQGLSTTAALLNWFRGDAEVSYYLALNTHGRYLLHSHHELPTGAWCRILAKCRRNASILYYFLREQPQLVSMAVSGTSSTTASAHQEKAKQNRSERMSSKRKATTTTRQARRAKRRRVS